MVEIVEWVVLSLAGLSCLYVLASGIAVGRFFKRRPEILTDHPPITILKPLCGNDPELFQNLRSFCEQNYPTWQIVFGVRSPDDPAIETVRRLRSQYPDADLNLVVGGNAVAGNLKVCNLQNMLPSARYDILVVADSDIRVGRNYLAEVIAALRNPTVGLVTCLYRGLPSAGVWSRLACLFVNHSFVPQALTAAALHIGGGCFGATIALRRQTLTAIGGFNAVANNLADDHALGAAVRQLGLKVVISPHVVDNLIAKPSFRVLWDQELRWARTIRAIAPVGFVGSILTHAMPLSILALPFDAWFDAAELEAPVILTLALVCRISVAWRVDCALRLRPSPLWLLPIRDVLSFGVYFASFFIKQVNWRGQLLHVGSKGRLMPSGRSWNDENPLPSPPVI